MKYTKLTLIFSWIFFIPAVLFAQLPKPAFVGYWEGWSSMQLSQIHDNYNVIQIAFAVTSGTSLYNMEFNLPNGYSKTAFLADIDALHAEGKVVILSIGGANDPVRLDNNTAKNAFISSMNQILADYNYKFDGIDLDFESSSLNFGSWTMGNPAVGQTNMVEAVQSIMNTYQTQTGKKCILTMAPETLYVQGGLSSYQVSNLNGGAYLPIIEGLITELDLLHCQLYNAGGSNGGTFAIDGTIYYDDGDPDYITAMTETVIKGFTLQGGKGSFSGVSSSKVAIGLPASYNGCVNGMGVGSGFVEYDDVAKAAQYLQGIISKPAGWDYTLLDSYSDLGGMMTWSINKDASNCRGNWMFAQNFPNAFPNTVTATSSNTHSIEPALYPNPTTDVIHSEGLGKNITIQDVYGKTIRQATVSDGAIDVRDLAPGIYFITDENTTTQFQKN
jgi:chitinase